MDTCTHRVGDLTLAYESLGDPAGPTVLLVMGLGLSMEWRRDDLGAELVAAGFRVVRFDNRDVGESTQLHGPGVSAWGFVRRRARPLHTLGQLADDVAGLLAHLDPRGAHVVGASLGAVGAVGALGAQEIAIRHPGLTRSLVAVMGRPGDGHSGKVARTMVPEFLRPPAADPVEGLVRSCTRIGSVGGSRRSCCTGCGTG